MPVLIVSGQIPETDGDVSQLLVNQRHICQRCRTHGDVLLLVLHLPAIEVGVELRIALLLGEMLEAQALHHLITEDEALSYGWIPKSGNLASVAPGKMVTMGVYKNRNGHLPSALGREWFEADIDYDYGYRGTARIVFSNDGLIFVTFDHYNTFIEIVTEEDSE